MCQNAAAAADQGELSSASATMVQAIRTTPPAATDHPSDWKSDYAAMLGPMFFGETPSFEEIITIAADFENTYNAAARP